MSRTLKQTALVLVFGALILLMVAYILTSPAFAVVAQPEGETSLRINWGEYAAWGITAVGAMIGGLWAQVKGLLPGPARWAIALSQIDQVIIRKIEAWCFDNAERLKREGWSVDVRNQAVRDIATMALNSGNKFVVKYREKMRELLAARLQEYINKTAGGIG